MSMIIRPYTPSDKPACVAAFKSNMPGFFAPAELPDFEEWLRKQDTRYTSPQKNNNEQYYVATLEEQVIGCGGYYIDTAKQEASMTWGLITHALHKQGYGKQLFLYRVHVIQSICPLCRIRLDTTQHSYPFFGKLGFVVTSITKDSYGPGLDRYDMELKA
ncbi:GNAT family N-acetyltransferase [Chitinophaga ginsengisegetis]|uniref:GNAT family N-acetyltransferase n=2 Tax=Chitinophaga ginsengisegetis TaxID=393003 RepID=UPI000DBAA5BE|nr:GNAT family N-acetyltransferase [Chitinophaga ginsengisegetis]MDR6647920.1 N-acetylglutamate synthase-like GNAT family acetyltransferase [Chitinophaga ginsengisegetis]